MGCVVERRHRTAGTRCRYSRACAWEVLNVLGAEGCLYVGSAARLASTTKAGSRLAVTPTPAGRCSRHGCAPACRPKSNLMTTCSARRISAPADVDKRLNHLHRVTSAVNSSPELCIFAFDHRKQLADLARETGRDKPAFRSSSCCCFPGVAWRAGGQVSISAAAF